MKLNKIEKLKAASPPLDIIDNIYRWADEGFSAIPPERLDHFKWYGLFYRKQTPGYFMLRMRISAGLLSSEQLRMLAGISRDFGRGVGDLTSRQNIQLRWIQIEDVPQVFERIHEAGLTSQQTGMDNYRNVTTCPVAGLEPNEWLDGTQQTIATALSLLGREFGNLPRKFNISINGCRYDCTEAKTNDIGMTPATKKFGNRLVKGFNVVVAGAMGGKNPNMGEPLDLFVRPEQATPLCRAILSLFRDHGNRAQRKKGRMHWLIKEWGMPKFRAEVIKLFGKPLPSAGECVLFPDDVDPLGRDHIGVHAQKQEGLSYVGLVVPVGRFRAKQLFELAQLADKYGSCEVRLTNQQNVIIPNVPNEKLSALLSEPLLSEWCPDTSGVMRRLVTCTGKDYCHFALNDTKGHSLAIARELEKRFPHNHQLINLNVSGCIHACGRHRSTELGLQATRIRLKSGEIVDGFDIFEGGHVGHAAQLGQLMHKKATVEQTVELLSQKIAKKYSLS